MRSFAIALLFATLLSPGPGSRGQAAADDRVVTELDRRATLALHNSVQTGTVYTLDSVDAQHVRGLDVFEPKGAEGERVYGVRFGTLVGGGHGRGYHKITIGGSLVDHTKKGWTLLGRRQAPNVEIFWKRTLNSESDKYTDVAIRGKVGRVIMAVAQRRPHAEAPEAGAAELIGRYQRLLAAARAAGLFERVEVALLAESGGDPVAILGVDPARAMITPQGLRYRVRLRVLDTEDRAVQARAFTLKLTGPVAGYARIEGAVFDEKAKRYVIENPGIEALVTLVMDAPSNALELALYRQFEGLGAKSSTVRGIQIQAGAKLQ